MKVSDFLQRYSKRLREEYPKGLYLSTRGEQGNLDILLNNVLECGVSISEIIPLADKNADVNPYLLIKVNW